MTRLEGTSLGSYWLVLPTPSRLALLFSSFVSFVCKDMIPPYAAYSRRQQSLLFDVPVS